MSEPPRQPHPSGTPSGGCGPIMPVALTDSKPLRQQVFEHVRGLGQSARSDIARALGISAASVTALTSDLIAQGYLRETAATPPRDPSGVTRGRPPTALEVVPERGFVVGIKLSDERHTAVLTDYAGQIRSEASRTTQPLRKTADQILSEIASLIDDLLTGAAMPRTRINAIGIGLSGLVDHEAGVARWSPLLATRDMPLKALVESQFGITTFIDNDANVLTLAELWFGAGRTLSDFAVVTIEHGVGMGAVLGNRLFRGTRGLGLELGHTKVQLDGALCRCGQRGCLEAYLADYALAREASTALGRPIRNLQSPQSMLDSLFSEAKAGNDAALSVFRRAGRYLALGLSNVVHVFDPDLIILSGERMTNDYLYSAEVMAEMQALTLSAGRAPARVEVHAWGDLVWAQGATALALSSVIDEALGDLKSQAAAS